jgi:hypothetical protein
LLPPNKYLPDILKYVEDVCDAETRKNNPFSALAENAQAQLGFLAT